MRRRYNVGPMLGHDAGPIFIPTLFPCLVFCWDTDPELDAVTSLEIPANRTRGSHVGLTPTKLKHLDINQGDQKVFSIWNHHKCLS